MAQTRPSLRRWSMFAFTWHLSVWLGGAALLMAGVHMVALWVNPPAAFWVLVALAIFGELRPVFTAGARDPNGIVTSNAFVFVAMYLWGLWPAIVLQSLATLVGEISKRKDPWKVAFNIGQYALSYTAAWTVMAFAGLPDGIHLRDDSVLLGSDLGWVLLSWLVWFLVNNALVAGVAADEGISFKDAFFEDFGYYAATTLAVLSLAPLVTIVAVASPWYLPLLLIPLFAILKAGDISLEKEFQSLHDTLTGLPNRKNFVQIVDQAAVGGSPFAVVLLDLDRFKEVNDTLGHHIGDDLLTLVAARLRATLRPDDVVARLGGDEFALLLPGVGHPEDAAEICGRIHASLVEPFQLDEVLLELEASVGIVLSPRHGTEVDQLLRCADVAMYLAKDSRSGIEIYEPTRDQHSADRLGLLALLRQAIDGYQLELEYQPKIQIESGCVVGMEALVRWRHPERGLIPPDEFIPLAETSGLMHQLTEYVLDAAVAQAARWRDLGASLPVAVNVSPRDLHGHELIPAIDRVLDRHGIPATALCLELTERVLMIDSSRVAATLGALRQRGISLSLDDFGTGYHSMTLLKRLPLTEVKIDRSFVTQVGDDAIDRSIVSSIVQLAEALGLSTVAEGVESEVILGDLSELGVDVAQGYHVGAPMSGPVATAWLLRRDPDPDLADSHSGVRHLG